MKNLKKKTIDFRIFWAFLLLTSAAIFFFMIFQTTQKFLANRLVVRIAEKEVEIKDFPFPALTICPDSLLFKIVPDFENNSESLADDT